LTIVTREIQPRLAAKAWLEQASRRSAEWSSFRISDPWLNCCLQADTLIDVVCVRWIISPVKWQHRLSSRTPTGTELAPRQLIQSANTNPVESNETKSNNKSKKPYEGKSKKQTLTPVTCSYKTRFCLPIWSLH
jgi:hypothetical protein